MDRYRVSRGARDMMDQELWLLKAQAILKDAPVVSPQNTSPTQKENHMIEVGHVVTKTERVRNPYYSPSLYNHADPYQEVDRQQVKVDLSREGVRLTLLDNGSTEDGVKADALGFKMTPEQAVEIGQILMKAAETQAEYAKASKEIEEQKKKLEESMKDRISGLGFKSVEPLTAIEA